MNFLKSKAARAALMAAAMMFFSLAAMPVWAQSVQNSPTPSPDGTIEFNFPNVDIEVFIKYISELTGKNFVVDDRVKGQVSIISPAKISIDEAYKVFESVLEINGFTTVDAGEIIKVIPAPDARTKSIKTMIRDESIVPGDQVVTQLIPLRNADAEEIQRLLSPLVSKSSVILSYPQTNTLIVTDVFSNIERLKKILKVIDVPGLGEQISVIPLEYAIASKMEQMLGALFVEKRRARKDQVEPMIKFVADDRTNTIVVMASEDDSVKIKRLINLMDKEAPKGKGKIHVYYLENANADDLSQVLQEIPAKFAIEGDGKKEGLLSDRVRISADKATNSLIIMAEKDDYTVLEQIIRQLDIPRAMVYIESLIMEVNVEKSFDLGVDWTIVGKTTIDNKESIIGGGFGTSGGPNQLELVSPDGFNMGVVGGTISITTEAGTLTFPSLGAMVRAFQKDEDIHILSTPQILTTDNEEAKITVGRNIPYQTQSTTTENTTFNSFEYRDVGITLKITPHISRDRMVRLVISQEVTSIPENPNNPDDRPTTLKRSIDTTVLVQDQNTVVIGGLIDDTFTLTDSSVPCLGRLPLMKYLFSATSKNSQKTNLFVFLTPRVVQNPEEAEEIYSRKKGEMEVIEGGEIKLYQKPAK